MKSISPPANQHITDFIYSGIETVYKMCHEAGEVIMDIYDKLQPHEISYKSDYSPVTEADLLSDSILTQELQRFTPDFPIVSEESPAAEYSERKNFKSLWLLDPLDGTQGFIRKTGEFAINLALIHEEKVIAGCIYLPTSKEMYFAVKGKGSFEYSTGIQLKVNEISESQESLRILLSRHHQDAETREWIRKFNKPEMITVGGSLKFIELIKGRADFYPRLTNLMEWDAASGHILVEEAGGSFFHALGSEQITYNSPKLIHPPFIASAKILDA